MFKSHELPTNQVVRFGSFFALVLVVDLCRPQARSWWCHHAVVDSSWSQRPFMLETMLVHSPWSLHQTKYFDNTKWCVFEQWVAFESYFQWFSWSSCPIKGLKSALEEVPPHPHQMPCTQHPEPKTVSKRTNSHQVRSVLESSQSHESREAHSHPCGDGRKTSPSMSIFDERWVFGEREQGKRWLKMESFKTIKRLLEPTWGKVETTVRWVCEPHSFVSSSCDISTRTFRLCWRTPTNRAFNNHHKAFTCQGDVLPNIAKMLEGKLTKRNSGVKVQNAQDRKWCNSKQSRVQIIIFPYLSTLLLSVAGMVFRVFLLGVVIKTCLSTVLWASLIHHKLNHQNTKRVPTTPPHSTMMNTTSLGEREFGRKKKQYFWVEAEEEMNFESRWSWNQATNNHNKKQKTKNKNKKKKECGGVWISGTPTNKLAS